MADCVANEFENLAGFAFLTTDTLAPFFDPCGSAHQHLVARATEIARSGQLALIAASTSEVRPRGTLPTGLVSEGSEPRSPRRD
jgi:hypothetical protein